MSVCLTTNYLSWPGILAWLLTLFSCQRFWTGIRGEITKNFHKLTELSYKTLKFEGILSILTLQIEGVIPKSKRTVRDLKYTPLAQQR